MPRTNDGHDKQKPTRVDDGAVAFGWRLYVQRRDNAKLRNWLAEQYLWLANRIADDVGRRLPSCVSVDDLRSSAAIGLLQSIEGYSPDRGTPFESFALPRIRGAILDDLRRKDVLGYSTRHRADKPGSESIGDDVPAEDNSPDESPAMQRARFLEVNQCLTAKESIVVLCRYYMGFSFRETSEILRVTPSRVGQWQRSALAALRKSLGRKETREITEEGN